MRGESRSEVTRVDHDLVSVVTTPSVLAGALNIRVVRSDQEEEWLYGWTSQEIAHLIAALCKIESFDVQG